MSASSIHDRSAIKPKDPTSSAMSHDTKVNEERHISGAVHMGAPPASNSHDHMGLNGQMYQGTSGSVKPCWLLCYSQPSPLFLIPFLKQIPATQLYQAYGGQCNHTCHILVPFTLFMRQFSWKGQRNKTAMCYRLRPVMHFAFLSEHMKSPGLPIFQPCALNHCILSRLCLHPTTTLTTAKILISPRVTFAGNQVPKTSLSSRLLIPWAKQGSPQISTYQT